MNHWVQFRKDHLYLVKYLSVHTFIAMVVVGLQMHFTSFENFLTFNFQAWQLLLLPIGLIIAVQAPVLIHNCVHRNLRPKIMNQIAGELAGVYVLLSMASFELNHIMHHSHPDSDLDPHNPYQRNFLNFFFCQ